MSDFADGACVQHVVVAEPHPPVGAEDGLAAVRLAEQIVACVAAHPWDGAAGERVVLAADIFGQALASGSAAQG